MKEETVFKMKLTVTQFDDHAVVYVLVQGEIVIKTDLSLYRRRFERLLVEVALSHWYLYLNLFQDSICLCNAFAFLVFIGVLLFKVY